MPYFKLKNFCPFRSVFSIKHGLSVLFPKKYGFSVFNTKYGSTRTKYGVFSLKYGSPYIDLNRLEKNFGSVFFAFRAVIHPCHFVYSFISYLFLLWRGMQGSSK